MHACMYVMCILYHDLCHASAFNSQVSGINSYAHMLICHVSFATAVNLECPAIANH